MRFGDEIKTPRVSVLVISGISLLIAGGGIYYASIRGGISFENISDYAILFFASLFALVIIWTWQFTTDKKEFVEKGSARDWGFFNLSAAIISWGMLALLMIVIDPTLKEKFGDLLGSTFSTANNIFLLRFVAFLKFKAGDEPKILSHKFRGAFPRYFLDKYHWPRIYGLGLVVILGSIWVRNYSPGSAVYVLDVAFSVITIFLLWIYLTKIFRVRKIEILIPFVWGILLLTAAAQFIKIFPLTEVYDDLISLTFKIYLIAIFFGVILSWVYFVKNEELEKKKEELRMNNIWMSVYYAVMRHSIGNRVRRLVDEIDQNPALEDQTEANLYNLATEVEATFNNLSNFSISEVTQLEPNWETVYLGKLNFNSHSFSADRKKLSFSCDFSSAPIVLADKFFLKIILDNLIENAIKFTNKGQVKVYSEYPNEKNIHIFIEDSGIGFNKEDIANPSRLFDYYLNRNTIGKPSSEKGSGEGLFQVKQLAKTMKCEIAWKPKSGGGSIFKLTLCRPKYEHR